MADSFIVERIRAALQALDDTPADVWFAKMQRLGILDADGNVLRRMPEPPDEANGAAAPARKPRKKPAARRKRPGKPKSE